MSWNSDAREDKGIVKFVESTLQIVGRTCVWVRQFQLRSKLCIRVDGPDSHNNQSTEEKTYVSEVYEKMLSLTHEEKYI